MKKLIIYGAGIWAERLLTVERYKKVDYFVDENADTGKILMPGSEWEKQVFRPEVLKKENKDDVVIVISDDRSYSAAKEKLGSFGFVENKHFFNGWRLDLSFYKEYYGGSSWERVEEVVEDAVSGASFRYDERASYMVALIPDDVRSVLDIGCGGGFLRKYLSPEVRYYGSDICKRDENTIVYDINKDPLPDIDVDMYYMAGLVYYANDFEKLFSQMKNGKYILLDYSGMERWLRLDGVAADPYINARNSYTSTDEMMLILRKNGFVLDNVKWDWLSGRLYWHIYLFKNLKYIDR